MAELTTQHFEELEAKKKIVLEFLWSKNREDLTKSVGGQWCMIQVIRHIQIIEHGAMQYMIKKSQAGDGMDDRKFLPRLNKQILFLTYRLNIKFKAPKSVSNPPISSLEELEKDWTETRKIMKKFIEEYPDKWKNKAVFKHLILGRINLQDSIHFFSEHLGHHIRQLKRVENSIQ